MHAWCVSESNPDAEEGSGSMGRCKAATEQGPSQTSGTRAGQSAEGTERSQSTKRSCSNSDDDEYVPLKKDSAPKRSAKAAVETTVKRASKKAGKRQKKQVVEVLDDSDTEDDQAVDEPAVKKIKVQMGMKRFASVPRQTDRSGAPPATGVNRGLSMEDRVADAAKSSRARQRAVPKR